MRGSVERTRQLYSLWWHVIGAEKQETFGRSTVALSLNTHPPYVSCRLAQYNDMDNKHFMEDTSSESDNSSTEEDPEIPENAQPPPPTVQSTPAPATHPPQPALVRTRNSPNYRLLHTLRGHTDSISAVKFSPDGTLLASTCEFKFLPDGAQIVYTIVA